MDQTRLSTPCSAGTRASCHSAHWEMNCWGWRHRLIAVGQELAMPSQVEEVHDNYLTYFQRMLWKVCLYLQRFELFKCLTCLQRSSRSSVCGVVQPDRPLVGVSTRNDERCSASSQRAGFSSAGWVWTAKASPKLLHCWGWSYDGAQTTSILFLQLTAASRFDFTCVILSKSQVMASLDSVKRFTLWIRRQSRNRGEASNILSSSSSSSKPSHFRLSGVMKERAGLTFTLVQRLLEYLPGVQRQEHVIVKGY